MGQKITPNLWFDGAKEAVDFYVSLFPDSKIISTVYYPKTAEEGLADFQKDFAGKELSIDFQLGGMKFTAINGGPDFKFNSSISFMVNFDPSRDEKAHEKLDELWEKLAQGGKVLMPLDEYPYSKRYGWVQDKYGLTWQLILTDPEGDPRPFIIPSLMFSGDNVNKAEEAINYYVSLFKNAGEDAKVGLLAPYTEDTGPAKKGSLMFGDFTLAGQWFAAMDSGIEQDDTFNPAVSLMIACKDQEEIDYFWKELSTSPSDEQCGWCKDKYGLSWQIIPANMEELMKKPGAFAKLMEMHKIVIGEF